MDSKSNLHSSSPRSVGALEALFCSADGDHGGLPFVTTPESSSSKTDRNGLCMQDFIHDLPRAVADRKNLGIPAGSKNDPIVALFERLRLDDVSEWRQYAHFDAETNYTRNLVSTDDETYTLLLLCWNGNRESPIHDHPCDGCWMKVLQGQVRECRYRVPTDQEGVQQGTLVCTKDQTAQQGDLVFIEDSQGLHKVGNPGSVPSVTLHLYSPPFQKCRIWMNEKQGSSNASICHYSEYGDRI